MARGNGRGIGDYQAPSLQRTITNETRPLGPLETPITQGVLQKLTADQMYQNIYNLLQRMPSSIARNFREYYRKQGRDGQDFLLTSQGLVSVGAATANVAVITLNVQENFEGALYQVGFGVFPASAFSYIKWSLRINETVYHPGLHNTIFMADSLANPLPFETELLQTRKIELLAENTHAVNALDVSAILIGSTSFKAEWKTGWGDNPKSGIG